ncbi:unnamed protein product [Danaus chrysippus]|uniref:(African queen) hypothetical protein n=1 Tax=Danaus chrysippus TaxID=151541 RepID=A0A8J2W7I5_9NEOP|nr:unnamed protein product [Danaus chrysippus]
MFSKVSTENEQSLAASYEVSLQLARAKKPFSDGALIKKCAVEMAKRFMQPKLAEKFESVALSHQTVARRIEDMGNYITKSLCDYFVDCEYYSICLDESTDQTDVSQLIIFIRCISKDFTITEEMLDLIPFHGTTKGSDIFEAVNKTIVEYGGFRKCSCIVTDGAKAMTGKVTGFAGLLIQNGIDCPLFHCIIHQEALCGKSLRQMNAMKVVIRITNLIRGGNRSLTHRKFRDFLCEIDANYGDLLLHSEIRWLSAGQCLQRFFALRKEIPLFLKNEISSDTSELQDKMRDPQFLADLAFLTDMTQHLNELNLKLQGAPGGSNSQQIALRQQALSEAWRSLRGAADLRRKLLHQHLELQTFLSEENAAKANVLKELLCQRTSVIGQRIYPPMRENYRKYLAPRKRT